MKRRPDDEITAEIQALRDIKPRVRRSGAFGNNNHHAIEAQIEVLTRNLDNDDIWDKSSSEDDEDDEDAIEAEWSDHERDSALEAMHWRDGSTDDVPSVSWEELATPKES
jgi:hypothetical protein